ncbi:kinase-like protein [Auricularia subglabra TFB-10046 SS5]|nr:kinase-like protein [Auricularia subglabra TFB-10046 SS5]
MYGHALCVFRRPLLHSRHVLRRFAVSSVGRALSQQVVDNSEEKLATDWPPPKFVPSLDSLDRVGFGLGDCVGPDNRYKIARILGRGMYSNTWLARDTIENKYIAIKALTAYMTHVYDRGIAWEADAFRLVSFPPHTPHCARLLDEFTISGNGPSEKHMCFVMPVYGGDVRTLIRSRDTPLPLPLAKRILLHLLRGIAHLHERGAVHTDLKHDNVFFTTKLSDADIDEWLQRDPSHVRATPQPLPMISEEDAMQTTYMIADFGCAQPSKLHANLNITAVALRAPEVYLDAPWDRPADIWTFGCLVYEFITDRILFPYRKNQKWNLTETENMLYHMILHTEEWTFSAEQLSASPRAEEFFSSDCQLKKDPEILQWPIEMRFEELKVLSKEEAIAAATFIRRCLRLNPADRATAPQLLEDEWFADAA